MKDAIMEQYTAIRETIKSNVQTIRLLISQAEYYWR